MTDFTTLPAATVSRQMGVSARAVWRVLSDLSALPTWAPGIDGARVSSAQTSGVGAVRHVATAQFGEIEQHVTSWRDNETFAYETADSGPFARTLTTYLISETDIGADVTVSLAFAVKPGAMPVEQAQAVLSKGLDATLQGLEMQAKMVAETA